MNKAEFLKCVNLSLPSLPETNDNLKEIIKNFPYFQAAHILFARSLNQSNNILFSEALKNAAVTGCVEVICSIKSFESNTNCPEEAFQMLNERPPIV